MHASFRDQFHLFFVIMLGLGLAFGEVVQGETENQPLWQFGFGAGSGVTPHYPASDQSSLRFLAAPTFRYRGRVLRSDDEGTRARLMQFENAEVDLSGAASFPVGSSENVARQGMRQLDWIGEVGPRLNLRWKFRRPGQSRGDHLRLTIPIRAVASSDGSSLAPRGYIFQPGLSFEHTLEAPTVLNSDLAVEIDGSVNFVDKTLANYYFGVSTDRRDALSSGLRRGPGLDGGERWTHVLRFAEKSGAQGKRLFRRSSQCDDDVVGQPRQSPTQSRSTVSIFRGFQFAALEQRHARRKSVAIIFNFADPASAAE